MSATIAESGVTGRWRPGRTTLVAGGLVIAGFALSGISWWFFLLTALGAVGPGILREFGWLRDKDEFQRRAEHRAGYHAFLIAGMSAFILEVTFRTNGPVEHAHRMTEFFLALLWFTYILSSLLAYWGPQKTATRILYVFGSAWLAFAVVSNLGSEWTGWPALLLHPLIAAPFFLLGWISGRWPRIAGLLLVAVAVFVARFLDFDLESIVTGAAFVLLVGPLLATGVALLFARPELELE